MAPATRFLVTGCARSGTRFVAGVLSLAGLPCGHERVFRPAGYLGWGAPRGEASWYAGASLPRVGEGVVLLHQVRDPTRVVRSVYRLGLLSRTPLRTIVKNRGKSRLIRLVNPPSRLLKRWRFVMSLRQLVRDSSGAFDPADEIRRCERYWIEWNEMVERSAARLGLPYYRYRLEDFGEEVFTKIVRLLGESPEAFSWKDEWTRTAPRNTKPVYEERPIPPDAWEPSPELRRLARRYGYDV